MHKAMRSSAKGANRLEIRLAPREMIGNIMAMKTITAPINVARNEFCDLIKKVQAGARVVLTSYGEPKAVIIPYPRAAEPWRVEVPDDPSRYGDLQKPVMEPWE